MTAESNPRAAEVYCVRCSTCGVEWAMRWPPPVGSHTSPCGHLTCYRAANGHVTVYETGEEMPIAGWVPEGGT
jgi:hypothetical protein